MNKKLFCCILVLLSMQVTAQDIVNKKMLEGLTKNQQGILVWYSQQATPTDPTEQGMLLLLYDEFRNTKIVQTATPAATTVDKSGEVIRKNVEQVKQYWKTHTLEAMSVDYLQLMKRNLEPYKKDKIVAAAYTDLEVMIRYVQLNNRIIKAMSQPYNSVELDNCYKEVDVLYRIVNAERWKQQYGDAHWKELYNDKYTHFYNYPNAVKLFKELINAVNNDTDVKFGRKENDGAYVMSAALKLLEYTNNKTFVLRDGKSDKMGDNIIRYISHIPYLDQRFKEYRDGLLTKPLVRNTTLEHEILNMK